MCIIFYGDCMNCKQGQFMFIWGPPGSGLKFFGVG